MTEFPAVYNRFLDRITDDMYIELTPEDTIKDLRAMLISALPNFEFPRVNMYDYVVQTETKPESEKTDNDFVLRTFQDIDGSVNIVVETSTFAEDLTAEEINILAILMQIVWVQRQVTSIENTRMKYSGPDFKMTSQANHLQKLMNLLSDSRKESLHMQRLYKRRRFSENGTYESNWSVLREVSALDD